MHMLENTPPSVHVVPIMVLVHNCDKTNFWAVGAINVFGQYNFRVDALFYNRGL